MHLPRTPAILTAALVLAASHGAIAAARTTPQHHHRPAAARTAPAARGLAFATKHCAACHGITANSSSPEPEAPPWDDIANRPGTTAQTVATFLADAHNYPAAMDFTVTRAAARDLAAYLVTLRRPGYRPTR